MTYRFCVAITLGVLVTALTSTFTRADDSDAAPEHFLRCDMLANSLAAEEDPWPVVIVCQIIDEGNPFTVRESLDGLAATVQADEVTRLIEQPEREDLVPSLEVVRATIPLSFLP